MSDESQLPESTEDSKVKVSDRRRFSAEGEERPADQVDPPDPPAAADTSARAESAPHDLVDSGEDRPGEASGRGGPSRIPAASFELLVLSLAMQAQMELGLGEPQQDHIPDFDIARHTIDMLAILQQKTKGNLSLPEQRLLENTLTELRFRYVQAIEQINKKAKG